MPASREMEATNLEMHGFLGSKEWAAPECVTDFDVNARLTFTSVKAHEWADRKEVLHAKVALLAAMVRKSRNCLAFTGAGISTAAGIDDYATKAKEASVTATATRPTVRDWKDARPTRAHRVLTAMYEAGMLKHWVQQNHDSLPQKAGFPQHALNEIHGSLHDPANPIVPYEGTLRDDLFDWMHEWEFRNDLCLSLGTSLSGFNVDSVVETAAERARHGRSQGLVIVNLQQTPYDAECSLRIFAPIDAVMELLALELGIGDRVRPMDHVHRPDLAENSEVAEDVFRVPFDADGNPTKTKTKTIWDLRVGRRLRLTGGPYAGDVGRIIGKNDAGHYRIRFEDSIHPIFKARRRPFSLWLGNWWLEEATKGYGICPGGKIPFVNVVDFDDDAPEPDHHQPLASSTPSSVTTSAEPKKNGFHPATSSSVADATTTPTRPPKLPLPGKGMGKGKAPPPPPPALSGKGTPGKGVVVASSARRKQPACGQVLEGQAGVADLAAGEDTQRGSPKVAKLVHSLNEFDPSSSSEQQ